MSKSGMRALSLTQPWCSIVAAGLKPVENRQQRFWGMLGETFALHASLKWDKEGADFIALTFGGDPVVMAALAAAELAPKGAVLGVARCVGYLQGNNYWDHETQTWGTHQLLASPWFFGKYGYVLDRVEALPRPIPCKGALGVWRLPEEVAAEVLVQIARPAEATLPDGTEMQVFSVKTGPDGQQTLSGLIKRKVT